MSTQSQRQLPAGSWKFKPGRIPMAFTAPHFAVQITASGENLVSEVRVIDAKKTMLYTVKLVNGRPSARRQDLINDPTGTWMFDLAPCGELKEMTPDERRRMNHLLHMAAGRNIQPFKTNVSRRWRNALDMCASRNSQRHTPRRHITKVSQRKAHKR